MEKVPNPKLDIIEKDPKEEEKEGVEEKDEEEEQGVKEEDKEEEEGVKEEDKEEEGVEEEEAQDKKAINRQKRVRRSRFPWSLFCCFRFSGPDRLEITEPRRRAESEDV
ncbi:uncharacterized protein [Ranitomeya imitator]|uniref:uncharacterized protein n=1 Tax=Ranitomeya imitator TaxID=111125 RepID=UPI0037E929CC